MSIEWDSLILGGNELKTVGPATENARRANSVRAAEERRQSASVWLALRQSTVMEIWRRGRRQHRVSQHRGLVRDAVFHWQSVQ